MSVSFTTNQFIAKSNLIHNFKYDYTKTIYVKATFKVKITCSIHGDFEQRAGAHIRGKGCQKCGFKNKLSNSEDFIKKSKIIHNNKFNYSKTIYVKNSKKVIIICPIHKDFEQTPNSHLAGIGCNKCGRDIFIKKMASTTEDFIKKSIKIHGNSYDYSLVNYSNNATKVKIICNKCKTEFTQSPNRHLCCKGICKCLHLSTFSKTGWVNMCNSKPCIPIVYIIRCFNKTEEFVKIGITTQLIHRRFCNKNSMPYSYEIIKEIKGSPDFIYDKEHELHKLYRNYSYKPLIIFPGSKLECFNISILQEILKHPY